MMKRVVLVLAIVALMPLLMGAGGSAPPPFPSRIQGQDYKFVLVLDPHMAADDTINSLGTDITPKAKQATIRISRGVRLAAAVFKVVVDFPLFRGCDLNLTDARFLYPNATLGDLIPADVLQGLFIQLGEPIGPTRLPVVTRIEDDRCHPDPQQPALVIPDGGDGQSSLAGVLSITGTIRFAVPK